MLVQDVEVGRLLVILLEKTIWMMDRVQEIHNRTEPMRLGTLTEPVFAVIAP